MLKIEIVVCFVRADPEPGDSIAIEDAQSTVMGAYTRRVQRGITGAHSLEVKAPVPGIVEKETMRGAGLTLGISGKLREEPIKFLGNL